MPCIQAKYENGIVLRPTRWLHFRYGSTHWLPPPESSSELASAQPEFRVNQQSSRCWLSRTY
ncbi:hypothetical protein LIA77_09144 [Sarocladium implicatum]|nr:hypothetical protein LIA77_09144 [Sarocladium implicatum]